MTEECTGVLYLMYKLVNKRKNIVSLDRSEVVKIDKSRPKSHLLEIYDLWSNLKNKYE